MVSVDDVCIKFELSYASFSINLYLHYICLQIVYTSSIYMFPSNSPYTIPRMLFSSSLSTKRLPYSPTLSGSTFEGAYC